MKIKTRLMVFLVPSISLILAVLIFINYRNASEQATALAGKEIDLLASRHSSLIFGKLRNAEVAAVSLAGILRQARNNDPNREALSLAVKGVAESWPDFFGVWALWEPDAFDGKDAAYVGNPDFGNSTGSANAYWLRQGGKLIYNLSDGYADQSYYALPKSAGKMTVIPPYRDEDTADKVLMTTVTVPILEGGRVLGVVGVDLELDFIQGLITDLRPYGKGYTALISDRGTILAGPLAEKSQARAVTEPAVLEGIRTGEPFSIRQESVLDRAPVQTFFIPVMLESFEAPWYFALSLPMDQVSAASRAELLLETVLSLAALLLLLGLVYYTAAGVSGPLQRIAVWAKQVADGDYAATVDRKGFVRELEELQNAVRLMLASLFASMEAADEGKKKAENEAARARLAMSEAEKARTAAENATLRSQQAAAKLEGIVEETRNTVSRVVSSIDEATEGTEKQKLYASATAAAMLEMSGAVGDVAKTAVDAFAIAEQTREKAAHGAELVGSTVQAITNVDAMAKNLAEAMKGLGEQAQSISFVMNVITDIADQTNLLALNAAIEAARAGEAGRGFAVVANEVRKLAEKTVTATKEVGDVTTSIQRSTDRNINAVEEALQAVQKSTALARNAGASLDAIVGISQTTAGMVHAMATASEEQSATSEEITVSTEGVKAIAEENSELMAVANDNTRAIERLTLEISTVVRELRRI